MKEMSIYVIGTYDKYKSMYQWIYYLNYKKYVIKRSGYSRSIRGNEEATLEALEQALQKVTEPCVINIFSKIRLGFSEPEKSRYKERVKKILDTIVSNGHIVKFIGNGDFSIVDMWESKYGTKEPQQAKTQQVEQQQTTQKTAQPDIKGKEDVNDVFSKEEEEEMIRREWAELMSEQGHWVPGSGGY